jgi:cytochrome P450
MVYRAILHDADVYPDPLNFSPERFSDQEKNNDLGINKLPWPAFGFGRRFVIKILSFDQNYSLPAGCVLDAG